MHRLPAPSLLIVLTCAGCTTSSAGITDNTAPSTVEQSTTQSASGALTGDWGGERAALTLTPGGGQIEYDCAHGTLDAPLVPDASGAFSVPGRLVRQHGGPVRMGEQPQSQPALYQGSVSGDRLQLRVTSNGAEIGSYLLRRGASAQLVRCL